MSNIENGIKTDGEWENHFLGYNKKPESGIYHIKLSKLIGEDRSIRGGVVVVVLVTWTLNIFQRGIN